MPEELGTGKILDGIATGPVKREVPADTVPDSGLIEIGLEIRPSAVRESEPSGI